MSKTNTAAITTAIPDEDSPVPGDKQHKVSLYGNKFNDISLEEEGGEF